MRRLNGIEGIKNLKALNCRGGLELFFGSGELQDSAACTRRDGGPQCGLQPQSGRQADGVRSFQQVLIDETWDKGQHAKSKIDA